MKDTLKNILSSLPHSPGVYQFFSENEKIMYVGKSKNLKSRVNSYFSGQQKLNFAKKKMIEKITNIKYIVTNNETESLLLENTLIKEHQPKYNILLKDDKNFLYIKITKEKYPKILKTRIKPENKRNIDSYYGPYTSGYYVGEIMKILKKIFGYGVAQQHFFRKTASYNLDKYIFKGNIEASEQEVLKQYQEKISQIRKFLSGDTKDLQDLLKRQMLSFAEKLDFEQAAKKKVQLQALESLDTLQVVRDGVSGDFFVVHILEKYDSFYIGTIDIISGKIMSYQNYQVEAKLGENIDEILQNFVEQKWSDFSQKDKKTKTFLLPRKIYISPELDIFGEFPQQGAKHELLKLCYKNLYEFAHKKYMASLLTKGFSKKTMQELLHTLEYKQINKDIIFECNDISHLSGTHTVASRSIIENGRKNPKKYKKFRIKNLEEGKIDDFDSMREIMTRRMKELEKIGNYPDLIVIDGGKGQLSVVMEIIHSYLSQFSPERREETTKKIQVVSIAKREEELFLPNNPIPIILKKESSELRMLQMLRDEAHRFAISFNRDSRSKAMKKNILESIPGIGAITRKKILNKYGSVDALQSIEKQELNKILGKTVTENLENHGLI